MVLVILSVCLIIKLLSKNYNQKIGSKYLSQFQKMHKFHQEQHQQRHTYHSEPFFRYWLFPNSSYRRNRHH